MDGGLGKGNDAKEVPTTPPETSDNGRNKNRPTGDRKAAPLPEPFGIARSTT
jgi:hypothetical protein